MAKTTLVSKATSTKRLNVLMKVADSAPADSALAILHPWDRRKTGDAVVSGARVCKDDAGNHYIAFDVVCIDDAPIEELTKLATDIVNQEGLPKWMVQAGRRIEVQITERGPGKDSECWQLYGDQDEPYA